MKMVSYKSVFLSLFFFIANFYLVANPILPLKIHKDFRESGLTRYIRVYRTPENYTAEEVFAIAISEGLLMTDIQQNTNSLKDFHWLFFRIENMSGIEKDLVVDFDNAHVDTIEFYRINSIGHEATRIGFGGDKMPFNTREVKNRRFIFPFTISPNSSELYLLKIDQRYSTVSYPVRISEKAVFFQKEERTSIFYGLYFGGLIFIFAFSIAVGVILKEKVFYYYGSYAFIFAIFIADNLGFLFKYIYPEYWHIKNFLHIAFVPILLASFVEFSYQYFEMKERFRKIRYAMGFDYAIVVCFYFLLIFIYKPSNLFIFAYFTHFFLTITVVIALIFIFKSIKIDRNNTILYIIASGIPMVMGILFLLADSEIISMNIFPVHPIVIGSIFELFVFSIALMRRIKELSDKKNALLLQTAQQQKEIVKAFIKGREEESSRISKELHDDIGSRLALLRSKCINRKTDKSELYSDLEQINNLIRKISHELSPASLDVAGFAYSVERFLLDFGKNTSIKSNLYINDSSKISGNLALQLLRIIQEAAQNCIKYSKAHYLNIQIITHPEEIVLTIDDDGIGFDIAILQDKISGGFQNMKARAESINGDFEISSVLNHGTHIMVTVPH